MGEAVAEAMRHLPAWVRFGPYLLAGPVLGAALAALVGFAVWLTARTYDRLPAGTHWTERARTLWVARRAAGRVLVLVPVLALMWFLVAGRASSADRWGVGVTALLAVAGGMGVGSAGLRRRLGWRPLPWGESLRRAVALRLAMYSHVYAAVVVAVLLPREGLGWAIGGVLLVVGLAAAGFAGLPLELGAALGVIDPPDERLRRLVGEAAAGAGHAAPRTFVVPSWIANAAAFPPGQRLFFTSRALDELDDDAIRAIAAHEVAHLTEGRWVQLARMSGALVLVPLVLLPRAFSSGSFGMALLGGATFAALLVAALVRRTARRMEERADAHASGGDQAAYPAALERIYELNLLPAVIGGRRAHPDLYDRLVSAGATPSWPRPKPPPQLGLAELVILMGVVSSAVVAAFVVTLLAGLAPVGGAKAAVALGFGGGRSFGTLAEEAFGRGDGEAAVALVAAAEELQPWSVTWPARRARYAVATGDCAGAVQSLRRASGLEADRWGDDEALPEPSPEVESAAAAVRGCLDAGGVTPPGLPRVPSLPGADRDPSEGDPLPE